jgi:hypothetical protein
VNWFILPARSSLREREVALARGRARLPHRAGQARGERDKQHADQRDGQSVAPHEPGSAIPEGIGPRGDGFVAEIAAQVVGQGSHGRVALGGVLLERPRHDRLQVAPQRAPKLLRRAPAIGGTGAFRLVRVRCHSRGEPRGLAAQDRGEQLVRRGSQARPRRMTAREEPVQQHAERVDVDRRGDESARDLLRSGVLGCQSASRLPRQREGRPDPLRRQQLGHAEVEQPDGALPVDQDVRGLEVAVHDQVRVRVGDRGCHVQEQAHPLADAETAPVAVCVDRLAVHVLEHEIGLTRG